MITSCNTYINDRVIFSVHHTLNVLSFQEILDIDEVVSIYRQKQFEKNYEYESNKIVLKTMPGEGTNAKFEHTIYLSCVLSDQKYAKFLENVILQELDDGLKVNFKSTSDGVESINDADFFIVFLSRNYMKSAKDIEELNLILSRVRQEQGKHMLYVVRLEQLPAKPTYVHLVACQTCLEDDFWEDVASEKELSQKVSKVKKTVKQSHGTVDDRDVYALLKASCDIGAMLKNRLDHIPIIE